MRVEVGNRGEGSVVQQRGRGEECRACSTAEGKRGGV
jgi:hypothetical protein